MSQTHGLIFLALLVLSVGGAIALLAAPAGSPYRRWLLVVALAAALLPYLIHAQQTYESLVNVSPTNRLPVGLYPRLDRFIAAAWLTAGALLALGALAAARRPMIAALVPLLMGAIYFAWLLPMARRATPQGASPTAMATSWLYLASALGAVVLLLAARRPDRAATPLDRGAAASRDETR